jgi:hypothetical protein
MTNSRLTAFTRVAVLAVLTAPALAACAGDSFSAADTQYYASTINPRPELSGQKIRPSDVRIYANVLSPHPELMGVPEVDVANGPSATQSK